MPDNRTTMRLIIVALVILLCSAGRAAEVSWIRGKVSPPRWSIQPNEPNETDIIHFSGPTRSYLNRSVAESVLGGRPVLEMDAAIRQIQLRFEPPPSSDSGSFWDPVCGLQGSFGPLDAGSWQFLCTQEGTAFAIGFEVVGPGAAVTVLYVDAYATGARDGSSWQDAFVDLQNALATAKGPSEIRVAQGLYRPDAPGEDEFADPIAAFHLRNQVLLKGGYAGSSGPNPNERDLVAYESVLSGDVYGDDDVPAHPSGMVGDRSRSDNSYHVVMAIEVDSSAVLDGFTITGGHAFGSQVPDKFSCGSGIYIEGGSPVIRNCLITGNAAGHYGAGVYSRNPCAPTLTDCVIADNWSQWWGGGVFNEGSDMRLERCLVSGNGVRYHGGGVYNHTNGEMILSNCILSGNTASDPTWGLGGGLYSFLAVTRLNHCTLTGNRAILGASLACDSVGPASQSDLRMSNCILWDANDAFWNNDRSLIEIVYSDVRGGWPGEGNINVRPGFTALGQWDAGGTPADPCDDTWLEGDYRLLWESPCVDSGDPREVPDVQTTDFAGRSRLSGLAVDMGAYELKNDPPVADAGPNVFGFSITGETGFITLNARRSFDPEGQPLSCQWYRDGQLVSTEMEFTIELPLGEQAFTLIVHDGVQDSVPDEVLTSVTHVLDARVFITPREMERLRTDRPVSALVEMPRGKGPADFDVAEPALLFPGGVRAVAQTAFTWLNDRAIVLLKFNRADIMAAVPDNGPVELRVVGRLKDGYFFSGVDAVRIK